MQGASAAALVTVAGRGCRDMTAVLVPVGRQVIQKDQFVLLKEKKKVGGKKNAGTGVFGSWRQRMTSHAMQCPFSWGLRRKNALRCPQGGADVRLK